MALELEEGKKILQLVTSRYDDWRWRKKIEKTLSFPSLGLADETHKAIFLYLKEKLKAYKSRRADPDSWIVGGFATKEVIERAKFQPTVIGPDVTAEQVSFLGQDPGEEVTEAWWEDMLVEWFDQPELEPPPLEKEGEERQDSEEAGGGEEEKGEGKEPASEAPSKASAETA